MGGRKQADILYRVEYRGLTSDGISDVDPLCWRLWLTCASPDDAREAVEACRRSKRQKSHIKGTLEFRVRQFNFWAEIDISPLETDEAAQ